ncbi:MAG: thrombospondin type 3 repeat-containing protein, partial [Prosthecobacter sp.]
MKLTLLISLCLTLAAHALDQNSNQQSDIWEIQYGALSLTAIADTDHDGFTNAMESIAGTNPLDSNSYPKLGMAAGLPGQVDLMWPSEIGKSYGIYGSPDLNAANFTLLGSVMGDGAAMIESLTTGNNARYFFKLEPIDVDSDGDGLTDWEENKIGFNPFFN